MNNTSPCRRPFPVRFNLYRGAACLLATVALLGLSPPALAQESVGDRALQLEEVVVTGERREDPSPPPITLGPVSVSGYVQGSYVHNLGSPDQHQNANRYRLSDPDHDSFAVTAAKLGLYRRVSGLNELDAGFRFELAAGRIVEEVYEDPTFSFANQRLAVAQAYAELQVPLWSHPLQLRLGRMHSWFGVESLDLPKKVSYRIDGFQAWRFQDEEGRWRMLRDHA